MNNKALLLAILERFGTRDITSLVKLCYLADLVSYATNRHFISNYTYIRYYYGPYTREIKNDLCALKQKKIVNVKHIFLDENVEQRLYSLSGNRYTYQLSEEDTQIVTLLEQELKGYGAKALTDLAYTTAPMRKFKATLGGDEHINEPLDMTYGITE